MIKGFAAVPGTPLTRKRFCAHAYGWLSPGLSFLLLPGLLFGSLIALPAAAQVPADARRIEQLEGQIRTLHQELDRSRQAVQRLERLEEELRLLLDRMAKLPGRLPAGNLPSFPLASSLATSPASTPVPPVSIPAPAAPAVPTRPLSGGAAAAPMATSSRDDLARDLGAGQSAVLLGEFLHPKEVLQNWVRLLKTHPGSLGHLQPRVVSVDFGDGVGPMYRLKAGPVASAAAASGLCAGLRGKGAPQCAATDFTGTPGPEFWRGR